MVPSEPQSRHAAEHPSVPSCHSRAELCIQPGPEAFDQFDAFVRTLAFLTPREVHTLIVTGDEILDNLLTHGETGPDGVKILVRKRSSGLTLLLLVESHARFARFAAMLEREPGIEPRYDAGDRRWHGLGLKMCRNLAAKVSYRPGLSRDRVILWFRTDRSGL
jgi:anti-sigma regulatory factor (Ser/Thr protein kinase)